MLEVLSILDAFSHWFSQNQALLDHFHARVVEAQRISESPKPAHVVDLDFNNCAVMARITVWATGECEAEAITEDGILIVARHYDLSTAAMLHQAIHETLQAVQTYIP